MVGLERTFYKVSEGMDVVEMCAIVYSPTIDCPIAFPFNVSLSTREDSAGKHCDEWVHNYIVSECNYIVLWSVHTLTARLYYKHNFFVLYWDVS